MTYPSLRCIAWTSRWVMSGSKRRASHNSFTVVNNSLLHLPGYPNHRLLRSAHKFSIGLRSGDFAGQSMSVISGCLANQSRTIRAVWIGLLSWAKYIWNLSPSANTALVDGSSTFSKMSIYPSARRRPPISASCPTQSNDIQPQTPLVMRPLLFEATTVWSSYLHKIK